MLSKFRFGQEFVEKLGISSKRASCLNIIIKLLTITSDNTRPSFDPWGTPTLHLLLFIYTKCTFIYVNSWSYMANICSLALIFMHSMTINGILERYNIIQFAWRRTINCTFVQTFIQNGQLLTWTDKHWCFSNKQLKEKIFISVIHHSYMYFKILNKNTRVCTLSFKFYVYFFTTFCWSRY